jgi:hypothetical protein
MAGNRVETCSKNLNLVIKIDYFKGYHPVGLFIIEIKSKSVSNTTNSIYYTELHVSAYFRPTSVSQVLLKTY